MSEGESWHSSFPNLPDWFKTGDWPSPEDPAFWGIIEWSEYADFFLADQVKEIVKLDPKCQKALAICLIKITFMGTQPDEETIYATTQNPIIYNNSLLSLAFTGPMINYFFNEFGYHPKPEESNQPLTQKLQKIPNIKEKIFKLSEPMKAFAWWTFFACLESEKKRADLWRWDQTNEGNYLSNPEIVRFLQETLGLNPPKIFKPSVEQTQTSPHQTIPDQ